MAIVTREQIMERIRAKIGDDTSDDTISLVEDINDTFTDYDRRVTESGDWERRYNENDAQWRRRYTDRFFGGEDVPPLPTEVEEKETMLTYENLFKEE